MPSRRRFLQALGAAAAWPAGANARAASPSGTRLVAAWDTPQGSCVGVLALAAATPLGARVESKLAVPTRAHAITRVTDDTVLVVARRPGDWIVRARVDPGTRRLRAQAWQWIEADRAFNGHAIVAPDGRRVLTTETDQDTGLGLVGVRDAATLAKIDEWPTHGRDPHELLWICEAGRERVAVANGGIASLPETGRAKHDLPAMDPSLVLLDATRGVLEGQWRLSDSRLSTRHLAHAHGRIAIALQAEHDDAQVRGHAPVLALFDGRALVQSAVPQPLAGYGGSVAALPDGFAVSCPRAGGVAHFAHDGAWRGFMPLSEACPLAVDGDALLAGGAGSILRGDPSKVERARIAGTGPLTLDNHWVRLTP